MSRDIFGYTVYDREGARIAAASSTVTLEHMYFQYGERKVTTTDLNGKTVHGFVVKHAFELGGFGYKLFIHEGSTVIKHV